MRNKQIILIIASMTAALLGLIAVQLYWIDAAIRVREERFAQTASEALHSVIHSLEVRESAFALSSQITKSTGTAAAAGENLQLPVQNAESTSEQNNRSFVPNIRRNNSKPRSSGQSPGNSLGTALRNEAALQSSGGDTIPPKTTSPIITAPSPFQGMIAPPIFPGSNNLHTIGTHNELQGMQQLFQAQAELQAQMQAQMQTMNRNAAELMRQKQNQQRMRNLPQGLSVLPAGTPPPSAAPRNPTLAKQLAVNTQPHNAEEKTILINPGRAIADIGPGKIQLHFAEGTDKAKFSASSNGFQLKINDNEVVVNNQVLAARIRDEKDKIIRKVILSLDQKVPQLLTENIEPFPDAQPSNEDDEDYSEEGEDDCNTSSAAKARSLHRGTIQKASSTRVQQQKSNDMKRELRPAPTKAVIQKSISRKVEQFSDVAARLVCELAAGGQPIQQRISTISLDSLLRRELANRGIATPFLYAVMTPLHDTILLSNAPAKVDEIKQSTLHASLFPNDILPKNYKLHLYFPEQQRYMLESLWALMGGSALCIIFIMGVFAVSVKSLVRQKKISDMKTSFINNMTHEFQTPISTISLASEALKDPAIAADTQRRMRFVNVIFDENRRLSKQVELILKAAAMEDGQVNLSLKPVNINNLIMAAIQNSAMQIENKGGEIHTDLSAGDSVIEGDETHLTNVINNLLDNACKYSNCPPKIMISTHNTPGGLQIRVKDNGIGMTREQQKRIFERFYRVPTGNRHDVKGFGLGLSYVDSIVRAHGGSVQVESELHKGSAFTLHLPRTSAVLA
jgi:signal transduction histidine kinase